MDEELKTAAIERCKNEFKSEWGSCDHLARFEAWSELYYRRFGRLSPGKSEPLESGYDSNSHENLALCHAWHSTGLAAHDAIMRVVKLEAEIEQFKARIEDLEGEIEDFEGEIKDLEGQVKDLEAQTPKTNY